MSHAPRANREYPFAECRYNGEIFQVTTLSCGPKGTPEVRMLAFSLFGIGVAFRVGHGAEAFAHRAHCANSRVADPVESQRWAEQASADLASSV